jgi:ribose 5-phosphate isomerase RpiB
VNSRPCGLEDSAAGLGNVVGETLHWPHRVLSELELARLREDFREIILPANAVITPSARDWIRARGIRISRDEPQKETEAGTWYCAAESSFPVVSHVLDSLRREGICFGPWPERGEETTPQWARWLADDIAKSGTGAVVFCKESALVCCVANRLPAIRAAAVVNVGQTRQLLKTLAANLLAVEMPGRTFFEIKQMLALVARSRIVDDAASVVRRVDDAGSVVYGQAGACKCASAK